MSRWFRHYAGMMRDDKLVSAAIRSKQPIERVVWIYGAILESAAEIDDEGAYHIDTAEMAYFLRADQCDIDAVVAALVATGRLTKGGVARWGARQFHSDRSAERQARFRARKKGESDGEHGQGAPATTGKAASHNGGVTSLSRHGDAPETETELDTEGSVAKATSPKPAKFILPDDIPAEPWAGFEEMRKSIGHRLTDRARHLAISELRKLAEDGYPPGEVLNHCTLNSYRGIYPPKDRKNGHAAQQPNPQPRSRLLDALNDANEAIARSAPVEDHAGTRLALPSAGTG